MHVATVHYGSARWVKIQTEHLRRHLTVPYQTWTSLEKINPSEGRHFDHVIDSRGLHAEKLNHLALEISQFAAEDDLLMFLDSDAFPIADPMPLIQDALARKPLLAVRRAENEDEPQPHPCFCVTTVSFWRAIGGDWSVGPTWTRPLGGSTSDVGAQLWRRLELTGAPWTEILRTNRRNIDPLHFAIYGGVIYHHGAGSRSKDRMGLLEPVHHISAPKQAAGPGAGMSRALRMIDGLRWRRWRRSTELRIARQSARIYEEICAGGTEWLEELQ